MVDGPWPVRISPQDPGCQRKNDGTVKRAVDNKIIFDGNYEFAVPAEDKYNSGSRLFVGLSFSPFSRLCTFIVDTEK